jgi:hypothetical protein
VAATLSRDSRGAKDSVTEITTHQHVQSQLKDVKINTSHTLHALHSYARDMQRVPRSQTRIRVAILPYTLASFMFILMIARCNTYRAHRQGSESPCPGVNPGSEPACYVHLRPHPNSFIEYL